MGQRMTALVDVSCDRPLLAAQRPCMPGETRRTEADPELPSMSGRYGAV
jgi:hypothetical protein